MTEPVFRKPPPEGDGTPAPKPRRFWLRFTLGALVIVIVSAAATSTSILLFIDSIAQALSHNNGCRTRSSASSPRPTAANRRTS